MKLIQSAPFFFLIIILISGACNDPATLDTDLLDEDLVNVEFTDTFSIQTTTFYQDSTQTYSPNIEPSAFPVGLYDDAFFGQTDAKIYAQLRLIPPFDGLVFEGATYDSIVLSLAYASQSVYGDTSATCGLEIYRINELIDPDINYFSNQSFNTDAVPLANISYTPMPNDSVTILDYTGSDTTTLKVKPLLRIRLDDILGQEIFNFDSLTLATSDEFVNQFNGLLLTSSLPTNVLSSFDLRDPQTRLTVYYTETEDNDHEEFRCYFTEFSAKVNTYEHDFSSGEINGFLDNQIMGDSLLFLQGMNGPSIRIELPTINDLQDVIINKAELVFTIAELDVQPNLFPPTEQIILLEPTDSNFVLIEDAASALFQASLSSDFGGVVETDANGISTYTMNLSAHLQDIIDGVIEDEMIIQPSAKFSDFSRVVLYGANHSTYPVKLRITYTKL